jgi:endoglucanase
MQHRIIRNTLPKTIAGAILLLIASFSTSATQANAQTTTDKTLAPNTRFFVPQPAAGSIQQAISLLEKFQLRNALLIAATEATPQAVWLTSGTPSATATTVTQTLQQANWQRAVPVFVLYNIPGRDCGSYSAGGAQDTAAYEAWIDAIAGAIGNQKVVIILEPDAIADLPSDCGYDPSVVNIPQATADRYTQINYAVTKLETEPKTIVYIDGGNSHWQAVGTISQRLVTAGVQQAQGFFSNVSNYNLNTYESKFDTWVSECIAFGQNPADGGWRLGNYSYCASQYYSSDAPPSTPVDPDNIATWIYTDQWFTQNMGTAVPSIHFFIDSSRNGQGPFNAASYANAPYDQPASVITTLNNGQWCNPPARGLGVTPTVSTGVALLDAYFWVKTPGQSDGTCDSQGGARAWDYLAYDPAGWPTDAASQAVFDPLWGLDDPIAGAWFPQQALDLAQRANPPLLK